MSFGGIVKTVSLAYVRGAREGECVIVHMGFAISVVDEAETLQTFEYLKQVKPLFFPGW